MNTKVGQQIMQNNGRMDNININNYYDWQLFIKRRNMKKIIVIVLAIVLLNSCGIRFGDYNRYQQVHGNKIQCNR